MSEPSQDISFVIRRPWQLYTAGVVVLLLAGWLWWSKVYLNPQRVFWNTLQAGMHTSGVTVETSQQSGQNSVDQLVQIQLDQQRIAHSLATLKQGNNLIQTEIIGTPTADYNRYRSIKTDQKNAQGQPIDTSKVLGVWAKSDSKQQSSTTGSHQFAQAVLGVGLPLGSVPMPIADLTQSQVSAMMDMIKYENVYDVSFNSVTTQHKGIHTLYTYPVKIQTILYVQMIKQFAADLGIHDLDQIDPNTFQSAQPLSIKLTIDATARQLVSIDNGQGYTQRYEAYGLPVSVAIPKQTIPAAEMQQRLSQL